eukprot:4958548-Alexandrium_andersonii.AAC.1
MRIDSAQHEAPAKLLAKLGERTISVTGGLGTQATAKLLPGAAMNPRTRATKPRACQITKRKWQNH